LDVLLKQQTDYHLAFERWLQKTKQIKKERKNISLL
jgi:hypothetical protein